MLDDARRYYPEGEKAAQVVGSVGVDNVGLSGVEQQLDERAARRRTASSGSSRTRAATPVSLDELKDGHSGKDLRLTLDLSLQDRAEQVLAGVGRTYQPKGATAIVMDPRNGDLLAMANWPRVNANRVEEAPAVGARQPRGRLHLRARLHLQVVHRRRRARRQGRAPRDRLSRSARRSRSPTASSRRRTAPAGSSPCRDILARSSNVGAVRIGQRLGARRFDRWVHRFGFGRLDRSAAARRVGRDRARARRTTRAPRSGTCRSARASPSRRSRWWPPTRRSRTAACS